MGKKIVVFLLAILILAFANFADAQQPGKMYRIGFLWLATPEPVAPLRKALVDGLRELGYVEGRNIAVENRFADGKTERLPDLAAELVRLKLDVILAGPSSEITTLKQATTTIPIVMVHPTEPVEAGFITSLAQPGGNITGLSLSASPELQTKHLALLKEVVPRVSRVTILRQANVPGRIASFAAVEDAARKMNVTLQFVDVRGPDDFERAFTTMIRNRAQAFMIFGGALFWMRRQQIGELAVKNRLPGTHSLREYAEAGLLMTYGANLEALYRRAAFYVDRILKGTKPPDLPVEQPMKFEFVINLKTANQLGLTIPQWTLMKADKVIR